MDTNTAENELSLDEALNKTGLTIIKKTELEKPEFLNFKRHQDRIKRAYKFAYGYQHLKKEISLEIVAKLVSMEVAEIEKNLESDTLGLSMDNNVCAMDEIWIKNYTQRVYVETFD